MRVIRFIHRWLGFILAVFIILVSISGGILIFKDPILSLSHPLLSQPVTLFQQEKYPEILAEIESQFQDPHITFLRFPREGMNAFNLWLSDGSQALVEPYSAKIITQEHWYDSFTAILFEIHTNLLIGNKGEIVVGCIGLALVFFVISGIAIWWPRRQAFHLKNVLPHKSQYFLNSHYTLGVLAMPFILWFAITGTTMVFHKPVTHFVTLLFDSTLPQSPTEKVNNRNQEFKSWVEILDIIGKTLPEGELQSWGSAKEHNKAFVFRKKMPEEWHPYGRTFILLDPYKAKVIQKIDARNQQVGMRIMEKIYPLHAVKVGGATYEVFSVFSAISLFAISLLGLLSIIRRLTRS